MNKILCATLLLGSLSGTASADQLSIGIASQPLKDEQFSLVSYTPSTAAVVVNHSRDLNIPGLSHVNSYQYASSFGEQYDSYLDIPNGEDYYQWTWSTQRLHTLSSGAKIQRSPAHFLNTYGMVQGQLTLGSLTIEDDLSGYAIYDNEDEGAEPIYEVETFRDWSWALSVRATVGFEVHWNALMFKNQGNLEKKGQEGFKNRSLYAQGGYQASTVLHYATLGELDFGGAFFESGIGIHF